MRPQLRSVASAAFLLVLASGSSFAAAQAQGRTELADHTPSFVGQSTDLGPADPSKLITVALHLKTRRALEQILPPLYDPASPNYRQWLTTDEINAALALAPSDLANVRQFLASYHLSVVATGPAEISAQGTIANVQSAFNVALHEFRVNGRIVRANTSNPSVPGAAGALVSSVSGLTDDRMHPNWVYAAQAGGKPFNSVPLAEVTNGLFYSAQCFRAPQEVTFSAGSAGSSPAATATYFGNRYGQDIDNTVVGTWAPCGYQPSDLWSAYGLKTLYAGGLDGTGETIAIVVAYGSTTIETDLAEFSSVYGLAPPQLTVIGTPTAAPYDTDPNLSGWADETTIDVEWAHAIAPGAQIVLVVSPDDSQQNLAAAVAQAATNPGVVVVSNSYGWPESQEDVADFDDFETANEIAAALGVSVQFSSGDSGDYVAALGHSDVEYPASSPWATAVGGVSVGVGSNGAIWLQTGWGANITKLAGPATAGSPPVGPILPTVPPLQEGFLYGSGGGPSGVFDKPRFQRFLPGRTRLLPDISWVGDPYTGVEVIVSADDTGHNFLVGVVGGTSVSAPMFSALWSIVNQQSVHAMGLAGYTLYALSPRAITDVLPAGSPTNPAGFIVTTDTSAALNARRPSGGESRVTIETPYALAAPLDGNFIFYSALFDSPITANWYVLTFGTDSSLRVTPGWDEVTGLGTPNGAGFVEEAAQN
jgi:subtilase family serine protease